MVSVKNLARYTGQGTSASKVSNTPESKQWLEFEDSYKTRLRGRGPKKDDL